MKKMNEQIIPLLADTLGTTTEQVWQILLSQARVEAAYQLVVGIGLIVILRMLYRYVVRKTRIQAGQHYADLEYGDSYIAWAGVILFGVIILFYSVITLPFILSVFLTPEYWILQHLLQ